MNRTNRVVNRLLLLIAGIIAAAVGIALILRSVRPNWFADVWEEFSEPVRSAVFAASHWNAKIPGIGVLSGVAVLGFLIGLLLLILTVAFFCGLRSGKTKTVLRIQTARGKTEVDRNIAEAILAGPLRTRTDVLSADTKVYRVRRDPAITLSVTPRQGARLAQILRTIDTAVDDWDALTGAQIPIVVHLHGRSLIDRWRNAVRVR